MSRIPSQPNTPIVSTGKIIHLTLSGELAGTRLCGISKENGPEGWHVITANLQHPDICKECLNVWNEE